MLSRPAISDIFRMPLAVKTAMDKDVESPLILISPMLFKRLISSVSGGV